MSFSILIRFMNVMYQNLLENICYYTKILHSFILGVAVEKRGKIYHDNIEHRYRPTSRFISKCENVKVLELLPRGFRLLQCFIAKMQLLK